MAHMVLPIAPLLRVLRLPTVDPSGPTDPFLSSSVGADPVWVPVRSFPRPTPAARGPQAHSSFLARTISLLRFDLFAAQVRLARGLGRRLPPINSASHATHNAAALDPPPNPSSFRQRCPSTAFVSVSLGATLSFLRVVPLSLIQLHGERATISILSPITTAMHTKASEAQLAVQPSIM